MGKLGMAGTSGVVTTRGTGGSERLHSICCFRTGSVLGSFHTATLAGTLMSTLSARVAKLLQGVPKKTQLCLIGHRGHQEWTRDKSRVSFENLRKFPF